MKGRLPLVLAVYVLMLVLGATRAIAAYPQSEVWIGGGGAAAFEKDVFNVSNDIESTPEGMFTIGLMKNLDARRGIGVQLYGATETTPPVFLAGPGGVQQVSFDLYTYNFGVRYRHSFPSHAIVPYLFIGASWALGSIESGPTGQLEYGGVSACAGPGARIGLGRRFMLSAEGIASFGAARWKQQPFNNSTGKEFDPSIAGGTVNLSFLWGWTE